MSANLFAQKDTTAVNVTSKKERKKLKKINNLQGVYNPLSPSKAAFYSAIFPGAGQIYNKKYWLTPVVWGALAIPTYYYLENNSEYKRYRTAYKLRSIGLEDEFTVDGVEILSLTALESAQEQLKENRDMSLLSGVIIYVLQIIEASVSAHLLQFNTDDNLTFKPTIIQDPIKFDTASFGLTIKYTF
ncbi:DUF5683 domain-containing protein [uncultured Polaribacter sp.]|uniref:DUF5683 domain-containing protein n=1 Tax=uncultured Polaribacter sp. TaxID=174711 RepID=UPI002623DA5A|nr:DUF5683 domain-containing protein [uncultured Polaribacter sp.]